MNDFDSDDDICTECGAESIMPSDSGRYCTECGAIKEDTDDE